MTTVDKNNFNDIVPEVLDHIRDASFISIDTEFTGLRFEHPHFPTTQRFDSNQTLYERLAFVADHSQLLQIGLGVFKFDADSSTYKEHNYSFLLHPTDDRPLLTTSSSLTYLADHGFDFSRCYGQGIATTRVIEDSSHAAYHGRHASKTGMKEVDMLRDAIRNGDSTVEFADSDSWMLADEFRDEFKQMGVTLTHKKKKDSWIVTIKKNKGENGNSSPSKDETPKGDDKKLEIAEGQEEQTESNVTTDFATVFKALLESKKAIIGHCCLFDWLYLYATCYGDTPLRIEDFGVWVTANFPVIWDTKYLIHQARKVDPNIPTRLEQAFKFISSYAEKPTFVEVDTFEASKPHDAGYDASMTGYIFVYLLAVIASGKPLAIDTTLASPDSLLQHSNIYQAVMPERKLDLRNLHREGDNTREVIVCQLVHAEGAAAVLNSIVQTINENYSLKVLKVTANDYYLWILDADQDQIPGLSTSLNETFKDQASFTTFDDFTPVKIDHMWLKKFSYI